MNNENIQNETNAMNSTQSVDVTNQGYASQPVQPAQNPFENPMAQPTYTQEQPSINPSPSDVYQQPVADPMAAVSNLNKEEAMEEALSHTTQYTPFQASTTQIKQEAKQANSKKGLIFIVIIALIMALFIIFLPQIPKLFGW